MNSSSLISNGNLETEEIGMKISNYISKKKDSLPLVIFLIGELGAGKTTLCRGMLKGLGYKGIVKSPTFNIVESYELLNYLIFHFDFYQISHQKELSNIGIQEYLETSNGISIIEWPEKMLSFLPDPDIKVTLKHSKDKAEKRSIEINSNYNLLL